MGVVFPISVDLFFQLFNYISTLNINYLHSWVVPTGKEYYECLVYTVYYYANAAVNQKIIEYKNQH